MEIFHVSRYKFLHTMGWALVASCVIVGVMSVLARATLNLQAALTDKPDIGIYLLLEKEGITDAELLREKKDERDYLVQTKNGPKFVKLKRGEEQWFVAISEPMHEGTQSGEVLP